MMIIGKIKEDDPERSIKKRKIKLRVIGIILIIFNFFLLPIFNNTPFTDDWVTHLRSLSSIHDLLHPLRYLPINLAPVFMVILSGLFLLLGVLMIQASFVYSSEKKDLKLDGNTIRG